MTAVATEPKTLNLRHPENSVLVTAKRDSIMLLNMTTEPLPKHAMPAGNNGHVTTSFGRLEVGQKCRVMLGGEWQTVERIPWIKSGSTAFNVRKCNGLQGRAFVYSDRVVEVVE